MKWAPATDLDKQGMLQEIGVDSIDDLFASIPAELRISDLGLQPGISELEVAKRAQQLANQNSSLDDVTSFLGAGCYDHYVPAVCRNIPGRSEFATAYTPYQPEISQGTLQAIFEFQTAICELTALPVANASLYDGSTAVAEAITVAEQVTKRRQVVLCQSLLPAHQHVVRAYAKWYGIEVLIAPVDLESGTTNLAQLRSLVSDQTAAVVVQQPNAFGCLEDAPEIVSIAESCGAVPIVSADPLSLGALEAPGNYGAHIVVGDGQPLGNSPSFGGPAFGYMAVDKRYVRRMPGRLVGRAHDNDGNGGFVLTLQAREQHIRREKATSNICTNHALNALAGIVYMSWLGPHGAHDLANDLFARSSALATALDSIDQVDVVSKGPWFREVLVRLPKPAAAVIASCRDDAVLAGVDAQSLWPEFDDNLLLVATTERHTPADYRHLVDAITKAVS